MALIEPNFNYLDYVCDTCAVTIATKLQVCQNRARRAVKNVDPRYSVTALHKDTNRVSPIRGYNQRLSKCTKHLIIWEQAPSIECSMQESLPENSEATEM